MRVCRRCESRLGVDRLLVAVVAPKPAHDGPLMARGGEGKDSWRGGERPVDSVVRCEVYIAMHGKACSTVFLFL